MALPITTKQIDGGMLLDADVSTQRSSAGGLHSAAKSEGGGRRSGNAFTIKRGRSQQMGSVNQDQSQTGIYGEKARHGPAMSASGRNPVPLRGQAAQKAPSKSMLFPPLNETSFSEQYKTFKALGGKRPPLPNQLEMSKDLQMKIRPAA